MNVSDRMPSQASAHVSLHVLPFLLLIAIGLYAPTGGFAQAPQKNELREFANTPPELGTFSISLAVSDLAASITFYKKLGFEQIGGDTTANWILLERDGTRIGLFQGMFEQNILTFNPDDVRSIQKVMKKSGISPVVEADESTEGAAHMILQDPDGNLILFDQFDE